MTTTYEQINTFLDKCEELKKCKFIMATTKIKDLLKCIVNSVELYKLFDEVTKDFDYISEKKQCLVTVNNGVISKSYLSLPQTVGKRLAFIFCLLVEFDNDTLSFNDFLRQYFPEDGSYFASYHAFCSTVIDSLSEMIKEIFSEQLKEDEEIVAQSQANAEKARYISEITLAITEEIAFVSDCNLQTEEVDGAVNLLNRLSDAVKQGDVALIDCLIFGYNYFALYNRAVSEGIATLIQTIGEYEQLL
jgi:prophage DNA circulation protein